MPFVVNFVTVDGCGFPMKSPMDRVDLMLYWNESSKCILRLFLFIPSLSLSDPPLHEQV